MADNLVNILKTVHFKGVNFICELHLNTKSKQCLACSRHCWCPTHSPFSLPLQHTDMASYCQYLHLFAWGFLWLLEPALPTHVGRPEMPGNSCLLVAALSQWLTGVASGIPSCLPPQAWWLFPECCNTTKLHLPIGVTLLDTYSLLLPSLPRLTSQLPFWCFLGLPPK